jgi:hypothetical protein
MPLITYVPKRFNDAAELMIGHAASICEEFAAQGIELTLRGLYYRIVARDLFPDDRTWTKDEGTGNGDDGDDEQPRLLLPARRR